MPGAGLEPARPAGHPSLSRARLTDSATPARAGYSRALLVAEVAQPLDEPALLLLAVHGLLARLLGRGGRGDRRRGAVRLEDLRERAAVEVVGREPEQAQDRRRKLQDPRVRRQVGGLDPGAGGCEDPRHAVVAGVAVGHLRSESPSRRRIVAGSCRIPAFAGRSAGWIPGPAAARIPVTPWWPE